MDSQLDLLERLIEEGSAFTWETFCYPDRYGGEYGGEDTPEWQVWKTRSYNLVLQLSADNAPVAKLVKRGVGILTQGNYRAEFERAKSVLLKALEMAANTTKQDLYGELRGPRSTAKSAALSTKVFVVHDHDQALKTDVERFLREIGLEPVVLHRQPDQGRTIIEKFEQHSDVGYAFILLTPDEIAYPIDQAELENAVRSKEKRARPNVIFEFGYFVGKLGRSRMCCLFKEGVVLPSDLDGLIYKKIDGSLDSQTFAIIKDLKAAGYEVQL